MGGQEGWGGPAEGLEEREREREREGEGEALGSKSGCEVVVVVVVVVVVAATARCLKSLYSFISKRSFERDHSAINYMFHIGQRV